MLPLLSESVSLSQDAVMTSCPNPLLSSPLLPPPPLPPGLLTSPVPAVLPSPAPVPGPRFRVGSHEPSHEPMNP